MPKTSQKTSRIVQAARLRNFVFGVEDSLVSTGGLLSGIAIADVPQQTILLTGVVLVFVEAFSMGVGSYLSESQAEGFLRGKSKRTGLPFNFAVIMFFSYFVAGFIPLLPYVVLPMPAAFWTSIVFALIALFALGIIGARASKISIWRNAAKMLLIGGGAVIIGVVVGRLLSSWGGPLI